MATERQYEFYHGTSWHNAREILRSGFAPSVDGCLGPGVYVSHEPKATRFAQNCDRHGGNEGGLVRCLVRMSNPKYVSGDDHSWQWEGHDACRTDRTSASGRMEWCVLDPQQIEVIGIQRVPCGGCEARGQQQVWAAPPAVGGHGYVIGYDCASCNEGASCSDVGSKTFVFADRRGASAGGRSDISLWPTQGLEYAVGGVIACNKLFDALPETGTLISEADEDDQSEEHHEQYAYVQYAPGGISSVSGDEEGHHEEERQVEYAWGGVVYDNNLFDVLPGTGTQVYCGHEDGERDTAGLYDDGGHDDGGAYDDVSGSYYASGDDDVGGGYNGLVHYDGGGYDFGGGHSEAYGGYDDRASGDGGGCDDNGGYDDDDQDDSRRDDHGEHDGDGGYEDASGYECGSGHDDDEGGAYADEVDGGSYDDHGGCDDGGNDDGGYDDGGYDDGGGYDDESYYSDGSY